MEFFYVSLIVILCLNIVLSTPIPERSDVLLETNLHNQIRRITTTEIISNIVNNESKEALIRKNVGKLEEIILRHSLSSSGTEENLRAKRGATFQPPMEKGRPRCAKSGQIYCSEVSEYPTEHIDKVLSTDLEQLNNYFVADSLKKSSLSIVIPDK